MKNVKKTKVFKGEWNGWKGENYSLLLRGKVTGLRINVHKWYDTNEVIIKLIEGDGRRKDFKEYKKVTLNNPTQKEIDAVVEQMLQQVS